MGSDDVIQSQVISAGAGPLSHVYSPALATAETHLYLADHGNAQWKHTRAFLRGFSYT